MSSFVLYICEDESARECEFCFQGEEGKEHDAVKEFRIRAVRITRLVYQLGRDVRVRIGSDCVRRHSECAHSERAVSATIIVGAEENRRKEYGAFWRASTCCRGSCSSKGCKSWEAPACVAGLAGATTRRGPPDGSTLRAVFRRAEGRGGGGGGVVGGGGGDVVGGGGGGGGRGAAAAAIW